MEIKKIKKKFNVGILCKVVDYRIVYANSEKEAKRKALNMEGVIEGYEGDLDWNRDNDWDVQSCEEVTKEEE